MTIFPTWYSTKWTPDWTDIVWSSDAITNFNLTIASIALYTMTNSSTTDLPEGTNLYYTETRVTNNTTVISKADKTNVLELDNTDVFTPTLDYHPATKKYVDDFIVPSATESVEGIAELSDTAQALAWTNDTTIMTPKKVKDNYWVSDSVVAIRSTTAASTTVTYPHNLGKIPSMITVTSMEWGSTVSWAYSTWSWLNDGSDTNKCAFVQSNESWGSTSSIAAIINQDDSNDGQSWIINNVTTTDFDVVYTLAAGAAAANIGLHFTLHP